MDSLIIQKTEILRFIQMSTTTYNFHLGMFIQRFNKLKSHFRHMFPGRLYLAHKIFQFLSKNKILKDDFGVRIIHKSTSGVSFWPLCRLFKDFPVSRTISSKSTKENVLLFEAIAVECNI